jgi:hypothetical protein
VSQFQFVGQAYEAPMKLQDAEKCVNWYPEISQNRESKTPVALLGAPGLALLATCGSGPVRGCWPLPGGQSAIVVSGNAVFMVSSVWVVTQIGTLIPSSGPIVIRDNGAGGIAVISDGANGYVVNIASKTVTQITDPAWLGATRIVYIDGWLVFQKPNSQIFYTSPLYWNGTDAMDATYYALKDSSTDDTVTMFENLRELWLIGERTTEVWYDAGSSEGQNFPFSRLQGVTTQHGCSASQSISRISDVERGLDSLIWLGRNERGQSSIKRTIGYQVMDVSTIAVNKAISSYSTVSDAIGYSYQQDEHEFYVLTFPMADRTWVWDATTNMWHERASYDPVAGLFHRHRSNCQMNFQGMTVVGDYSSGALLQLTRSAYTDNGAPLVAWRRTPHVWDQNNRERVFHSQLQIEFTPGVGLQTGQGSNPQACLKWSDDGGQTWGNEHWRSIGLVGKTKNRAIWRRMGEARDRVYDVRFSDPVPRDVVGASLIDV